MSEGLSTRRIPKGMPTYVADSSRPASAIPSLPVGFFLGEKNMELLNVEEAAKRLRASKITIRRMIKAGTIPYRRLGTGGKNTRIFFTPGDLAAYLEAATVPAKPVKPLGDK
jgi:excisionase family DNA binding protein